MLQKFKFVEQIAEPVLTARLTMRAPRATDEADIAALANNAKIHATLPSLPFPYGADDFQTYRNEICRNETRHGYVICLNDRAIGTIGFHAREDLDPIPLEIGYWLGEPYWGQGYAIEAANALIDAMHAINPLAQLTARALTSNARSLSLLHRAGFVTDRVIIDDFGPLTDQSITTLTWEGGKNGT